MAKYEITLKNHDREEVEAHSVAHEGDWIIFKDGYAKPALTLRAHDVKRYECIEADSEPSFGIA
jgi:hypothetical protein